MTMTGTSIRSIRFVLLLSLAPMLGCDTLSGFLLPSTTTVDLVNNGDFPVDVTLYYDDQQETPEFLLTEIGRRLDVTVDPGDTVNFTRNCDELQVIVIDDADLRIIGGIGPETSSDVLRDGSDFTCGSRIVFTFDHTDLITDFHVNATVTPF
ncbi:MAG: hypothetical protein D6788_05990 [Planctomycetota bacterium]|nr:MAG: hypothetical protein D6788_05990 [Planctomycetota bacterium]